MQVDGPLGTVIPVVHRPVCPACNPEQPRIGPVLYTLGPRSQSHLSQRVHVAVWYIPGPYRGSYIHTLGSMYVL